MEKCNHRNSLTGGTSIVFDTGRWTGVYPRRIKGICIKCQKEFSLTEDEYKEFLKSGVVNDETSE